MGKEPRKQEKKFKSEKVNRKKMAGRLQQETARQDKSKRLKELQLSNKRKNLKKKY